jgi:hypothetical protein
MGIGERRIYEKEQYGELSKSRRGKKGDDQSLMYFVIDASWVAQWIEFIQNRTGLPSQIDNSQLWERIELHRERQR